MRRLPCKIFILLLLFCLLVIFLYAKNIHHSYRQSHIHYDEKNFVDRKDTNGRNRIILAFVVCDTRFNESLNVVKSVLLFTKSLVKFIIFTDDSMRIKFNETLSKWRELTNHQLEFELHQIHFPEAYREEWMHLFSKCAAQRLFIPKLIPHIDAMIYTDTDTLFLGPVDELWEHFSLFNSSQISGLALEDDNPNVSWYPRFAKHPFYGKFGLNSGVMMMNLTRMRDFGWVDYVTPIMLKWKLNIPWGDQDIINIIFHYHERAVYMLSCRYNYRSDQCMYGDACPDATSRGVFILHGSRSAFHNKKQPSFQAIYKAINEHEIGRDTSKELLDNMEKYIAQVPPSNCGNLKDAFLKVPTEMIKKEHKIPNR